MELLAVPKTLQERITLVSSHSDSEKENFRAKTSSRILEPGTKVKQRMCNHHGSVADICSPLHNEVEDWDASALSEQSHNC